MEEGHLQGHSADGRSGSGLLQKSQLDGKAGRRMIQMIHDRLPGDWGWGFKHSPVETDPSQWRSKILVLKSYRPIIPMEEGEEDEEEGSWWWRRRWKTLGLGVGLPSIPLKAQQILQCEPNGVGL